MIPHVLMLGEPGSGKSVRLARQCLEFPGTVILQDPHRDSTGQMVLTHAEGDVLFDRISDLDHSLGYGLLTPATHRDERVRMQLNLKRARFFTEVMMRRSGGDVATTPQKEEWVVALLLLYLYQDPPKEPDFVPYGFRPGTDKFKALVRGCTLGEFRDKFSPLAEMTPRGLRSEVGSAARLIEGIFRDPSFLLRCRTSFDFGRFLQGGGTLITERGDADEDVGRTIMGAINMKVTEHCESRRKPSPPVLVALDECTNARTAGYFEQKKAGETRKYSQIWAFAAQHPDFIGGSDGYYQNCQLKEFFRTGDYTLARKHAAFVVGAMPLGDEDSRTKAINEVVRDLMTFAPGWRRIVGPGGVRKERVQMLGNPWPDWPGLREAKLREKIECIYQRPEYRVGPPSATGWTPATPPSTKSPDNSSPLGRLKRRGKRPPGASPSSDDGRKSEPEGPST